MITRRLFLAVAAVLGLGSGAQAATVNASFTLVSAIDVHDPLNPDVEPKQPDRQLSEWWGVPVGKTVAATVTIGEGTAEWLRFTLRTASEVIFDDFVAISGTSFYGGIAGPDWGWTTLEWDGSLFGSGSILAKGAEDPWFKEIYGEFRLQPAPVPLPFSATLLPLGFGALAAIRRRRRSA